MRSSDQNPLNEITTRKGAKGWFLTYPQCTATKEELLAALPSFSTHPVVEWVICRELHEDGSPHLHAFVKFGAKIFLDRAMNKFDFMGYHGNYQVAKSWAACSRYAKKDGDFIASFDTASAAQKRGKKSIDMMTRDDPKTLVEDGTISALTLPALMKARATWLLLDKPQDQPALRGIWVYGPPGVGKSHMVRTKEPHLYLKAQNKWWDGYQGQEAVLLDDFDKQGVCLGHYLKIWSDSWACTGEQKGATIPLNHKRFYITSNYSIDQLFPEGEDSELNAAIKRRFTVHHILKKDLGLTKRPPNRSRSTSS